MTRRFVPALLAAALVISGVTTRQANAQVSWEYSPYELQVWVAFAPSPELTNSKQAVFPQDLTDEAWAMVGAPWSLTIKPAPAQLHSSILTVIDKITSEQIEEIDPEALQADKIILLAVAEQNGELVVTARELDCRSLVMGRPATRRSGDFNSLAATALRALLGAFSPLVRVEDSKGKEAIVRVRAGGLIVDPANPVAVKRNTLLQPVIRRNDRYGKPKRIDVIEWTYLRVDHEENNLWICEVQTALRNPLTGRGSSRTLKLGLGVRPEGDETELQLVSLERQRKDGKDVSVPIPMEGYEIFAKNPLPAEDGEVPNAIPLGRTDWRGMITVKRDPNYPLRLIYVKNGRFLLARLPLIPGLDQTTVADLTSDDQRLEVEAFVRGIEATVMDLVARRHILATRLRRRLAEGKLDEAQKIMEEVVQLPDKDALEQMIASRRNTVRSPNRNEQRRIEAMLNGVQILIRRFLDDGLEVKLREEIRAAGGTVPDTTTESDGANSDDKPQPKKTDGQAGGDQQQPKKGAPQGGKKPSADR